jgi:hypothetical protein
VRVQGKQYVEIDLDKSEVKRLLLKILPDVTKVPEDAYVKEGKLFIREEVYTSHSWFEESVLRTATPFDVAIVDLYKRIKEMKE